jgi:hypothetical protein
MGFKRGNANTLSQEILGMRMQAKARLKRLIGKSVLAPRTLEESGK